MFTRSDLLTLIDATPSPAVSIFMPTHVLGRKTRQDPVRLKNLLVQAGAKLQSIGQTPAQAEALLDPAAQLKDDYEFWQHQDHGLALFLGAGDMRMYKVPVALEEQVVVGRGFHVRPLPPLLAADGSFLVLTITADDVRLFRGSRFALSEEDSSGLPQNLEQVKGDADYENPLMAQPIGRPRVGSLDVSKSQVQGASPEDWRKGRLLEYIRRIALALRNRLASEPLPVVVAADAQTAGHFRKANTLGPLPRALSKSIRTCWRLRNCMARPTKSFCRAWNRAETRRWNVSPLRWAAARYAPRARCKTWRRRRMRGAWTCFLLPRAHRCGSASMPPASCRRKANRRTDRTCSPVAPGRPGSGNETRVVSPRPGSITESPQVGGARDRVPAGITGSGGTTDVPGELQGRSYIPQQPGVGLQGGLGGSASTGDSGTAATATTAPPVGVPASGTPTSHRP